MAQIYLLPLDLMSQKFTIKCAEICSGEFPFQRYLEKIIYDSLQIIVDTFCSLFVFARL